MVGVAGADLELAVVEFADQEVLDVEVQLGVPESPSEVQPEGAPQGGVAVLCAHPTTEEMQRELGVMTR